jgi:hypothetical protein
MDEEGYFFITDRLKRMINASGFKVWPSEVELLLFKCPLVQEACVISSRDAYRGETVKAVSCCAPSPRPPPAAGHHRLGARAHGGLQGAQARSSSSTPAQERIGQGDVAAAAGAPFRRPASQCVQAVPGRTSMHTARPSLSTYPTSMG